MEDIKQSKLLSDILERAEKLCQSNQCSGLTRDYIIVAAMDVLAEYGQKKLDEAVRAEYKETVALLSHLFADQDHLQPLVAKWKGKNVPYTEGVILNSGRGKAIIKARAAKQEQLTAALYLRTLLENESEAIKKLHKDAPAAEAAPASFPAREIQERPQKEEIPKTIKDEKPLTLSEIIEKTKNLQRTLQETVLGQEHAINVMASGYFQAELRALMEKERVQPRATFLFAGPPGVGKTFLAESTAKALELPFKRFDMSEYTGPMGVNELSGKDKSYQGSAEGQLTGFVAKNPRCVLLFDEIEKASMEVIHQFLQVLDAGRLRDNRTDKEVEFKDAILIFTTNAGKAAYEDKQGENLSALSREVILDALSKDINPRTNEPYFPAAICSRFAAGNVVMFNHLGAHTLYSIIQKRLLRHAADFKASANMEIDIAPDVATALLLAEGAAADARTVTSRADSFFSGELYELFRLLTSPRSMDKIENIRRIYFQVEKIGVPDEIQRLFRPSERIHALAYTKSPLQLEDDDPRLPVVHCVDSAEKAEALMEQENISLILCDLRPDDSEPASGYLNREDHLTAARAFLHETLLRRPGIPVLLMEYGNDTFSEEEKTSYLRRGVRGFLPMDAGDAARRLIQQSDILFQQSSLTALARANQLVRFETGQTVMSRGEEAFVILFDMKLEKAVKAEDSGNVLSMLSTPKERFDDVIGAEDAKNELRFFINYMKDPKKYRRQGASAPKGILLYGPPGTGKTMLAKAFACESKATFIAAQGNQFFNKYIGEGERLLRSLFATARRYAPSVLFIDEIDVIAKRRTGSDSTMSNAIEQLLTTLLAEMDGFSTDPGKPVFVLGATNYRAEPDAPMGLDPAVLRRFDRRILVDLPNTENRKQYLQKEFNRRKLFHVSEEALASLADRSAGMSLAQLSSVLDLAIRSAMKTGAESIGDKDLDEAFETFNSGEKREWGPDVVLKTARHEAGHALISWLSGDKPTYVTVVSRSNYGGYMRRGSQEDRMDYSRPDLLSRVRTALGGRAAEIVYYGKENGVTTGASSDLANATELVRRMLCAYGMDDEFGLAVVAPGEKGDDGALRQRINQILVSQLEEAIRLIESNRAAMDALVDELVNKNSLNEKEIDRIFSEKIK